MRPGVLHVLACIGLVAIVLAVGLPRIGVGGFSWSDAPLHAMDGAFIHDLVRDRPAGNLFDWAARYFGRFPCLGIVAYYPPGFAAVEAGAYAVFGVSEAIARGTVLAMTVLAVLGLYALVAGFYGPGAGFLAAGLLATCPAGVTWARQVMLEWPATLWIVASLLCYRGYLARPGWRWGLLCAGCVIGAFMTKQTAGFVAGVVAAHLLIHRRLPQELRRPAAWVAAALAVGIIGAYWLATRRYGALAPILLAGPEGQRWHHLAELRTYVQYIAWLPEIVGWPALAGVVVAGVVLLYRRADSTGGLMLLWFAAWTLICVLFYHKEPRYFFFAVPPLMVWLARGWLAIPAVRGVRLGVLPLAALLAWQTVTAVAVPPQRLPDAAAAVRWLADRGAGVVLYDGVRDGQFVFDVRTNPRAAGRLITLRGSKLLYSRSARARWDFEQYVHTPADVRGLLDRYGVRYVIVESDVPVIPWADARADYDVEPMRLLRRTLDDEARFTRVASWPFAGHDPAWAGITLDIYEYRHARPTTTRRITIPVPAIGRDVTIELPAGE